MTTPATLLPLIDLPGETATRAAGTLHVVRGEERSPLPLARVSLTARVASRIADVTVSQTFQNPYPDPLEAVYVFPLPGGAAVSRFELRVKDRVVRGVAAERGEARRRYQEALDAGKRAALLEEERDDVFTMQVGNLPPGEEVTVTLAYAERLPFFADGTVELRLPLVVAPRYIAGTPLSRPSVGTGTEPDTDVVPDASRITPPLLAPGFDPRTALAVDVTLEGEVVDLSCSQHATRTSTRPGASQVSLAREGERLDRDFVLRYRVRKGLDAALLVHRAANGPAYAVVSLAAPSGDAAPAPRDVVFVLDRSGSMEGPKMASAARACALLLRTLGPADRFAIQAFDDAFEWLGGSPAFLAATEGGIARGEAYLRGVTARNGTELAPALELGLDLVASRGETGRVASIVLLTDGQVGDEAGAFRRIQGKAGATRVFTVGIDTAVNEGFLKRVASLGRGTATFVEPGARLEEALQGIGRDLGSPLVLDLAVSGDGVVASSLTPARAPDLFAGRAVDLSFRLEGEAPVTVAGRRADGTPFSVTVPPVTVDVPAIATLWARARVVDLEDRFRMEPQSTGTLRKEIVDLALAHGLVTRFTAFVAVDDAEVVAHPERRRQVAQPVEAPAQWEMLATAGLAAPAAPPPPPSPMPAGRVFPAQAKPKMARVRAPEPPAGVAAADDLFDRTTTFFSRTAGDEAPAKLAEAASPSGSAGASGVDMARIHLGTFVRLVFARTTAVSDVRKALEPLLKLARSIGATDPAWKRVVAALEALLAAIGRRPWSRWDRDASVPAFVAAVRADFPDQVPDDLRPFWEETV